MGSFKRIALPVRAGLLACAAGWMVAHGAVAETVVRPRNTQPESVSVSKPRLAPEVPDPTGDQAAMAVDTSDASVAEPEAWAAYRAYEEAYAAYEAEDWKQAQRLIDRAIAGDPDNAEFHKLNGYIAGRRDDNAGVLRAAEAALAVDDSDGEAYEMRANAHYFLGDRERALADYRQALEHERLDAGFYRNYLHVLTELKRYDEMLAVYDSYVKHRRENPEDVEAKSDVPFYAAQAYYARKDYPRAIALLTEAIELAPDFAGYYGNRGAAYDEAGQYSLALADYAAALRLEPKDPDLHYNRGVTWLHLRDYAHAVEDFTRAQALGRDDVDVWLNLGAANEGLGRDGPALRAYDRALAIDPDNASVRANRVDVLRKQGRNRAADRDHAQALAGLPDDRVATLRFNDALARIRDNDWAGALPLLQEAVRLKPDFEQAWVNLGAAQAHLGQGQRALEVFNDVLARFPDSTLALSNRARILGELGDTAGAGRDHQRLVTLAPANAGYLESMARHQASTGDRGKARSYFEHARVAATNETPEVYINYSAFLLEAGDNRQALVVAREGMQRFPSNYGLVVNLANALDEAGDDKGAVSAYRRAIALQPERLDAYYNLGNQYAFSMKQPGRAIEWYRKALQRSPDPTLDAAGQREQRMSVRLNLASALELAGDTAGALAAMQEGIDADPDDYRMHYNRAGFALRAGDQAGARRDYAAALERMQRLEATPAGATDPAMLEYMGYALFFLGRDKEAVGVLEQLLQQKPDNHSARRSLGYVLLDLDRPAEACQAFDRAFTDDPDEIDGWLGLLACSSLQGDTRRLAGLKAQFGKRFDGRYSLGAELPQQLIEQDYWYSPRFLQLWARVMAAN